MKISKVKSKPSVYFENLNAGDLFEYEGEIYMKIEEVKTPSSNYVNAVWLKEGVATKAYVDELIEPIYEDEYIFEIDCCH